MTAIQSRANADVEATVTRQNVAAVESVSRPAARRCAATTSEKGRDRPERRPLRFSLGDARPQGIEHSAGELRWLRPAKLSGTARTVPGTQFSSRGERTTRLQGRVNKCGFRQYRNDGTPSARPSREAFTARPSTPPPSVSAYRPASAARRGELGTSGARPRGPQSSLRGRT